MPSESKSDTSTFSETPTFSSTPSESESDTSTFSDTPTVSTTPSVSESPSGTASATPSHSATLSSSHSSTTSPTLTPSPSNSASPTSTSTLVAEEEVGRLQLVILGSAVAGSLGILALVAFVKYKFFPGAAAASQATHPEAIEFGQIGAPNCPTAV